MFDATFAVIENENKRNELAEFYAKNKSRLYFIALSKLHNIEEAEDAVQEAFSRLVDKPEAFFKISSEKRLAYVDVIVRNIAVDMFNAKNKMPLEQLYEQLKDANISLENALFDKISRDEVIAFINKLPTLQRNVLVLHCFFDLSIDETAQRLNISLTVATKRLALARKAIRNFVEERGKNHG